METKRLAYLPKHMFHIEKPLNQMPAGLSGTPAIHISDPLCSYQSCRRAMSLEKDPVAKLFSLLAKAVAVATLLSLLAKALAVAVAVATFLCLLTIAMAMSSARQARKLPTKLWKKFAFLDACQKKFVLQPGKRISLLGESGD